MTKQTVSPEGMLEFARGIADPSDGKVTGLKNYFITAGYTDAEAQKLRREYVKILQDRGLLVRIGEDHSAWFIVDRLIHRRSFSLNVIAKAHTIIAADQVKHQEGDTWKVKDYIVKTDGETYGTCTCPHGEYGTPVGISTCKHVASVVLMLRSNT